jgi:competence protein ComEA
VAISDDNSISSTGRFGPLLRRADQVTIAAILAVSLAFICFVYVRCYLQDGGPVEIDRSQPQVVEFKVDMNQATWPELAMLPGVGETLARRIVQSREEDGPFLSHDDLRRVTGIGPRKLEDIRPYLLPLNDVAHVADK